jgi:hypothetical protein
MLLLLPAMTGEQHCTKIITPDYTQEQVVLV